MNKLDHVDRSTHMQSTKVTYYEAVSGKMSPACIFSVMLRPLSHCVNPSEEYEHASLNYDAVQVGADVGSNLKEIVQKASKDFLLSCITITTLSDYSTRELNGRTYSIHRFTSAAVAER